MKVRGGGEKNSHGIEENTTNEKNNKSGKEEQKPGTEIGEGRRDGAGNLSNSTQTAFVDNLKPPAAVKT